MKIEVRFETIIPEEMATNVSYKQILDWLKYRLQATDQLSSNPLKDVELEVDAGSVDYEDQGWWIKY